MDPMILFAFAAAQQPAMELVYNTQAYAEIGSATSYKITWLPFFSTSTSHALSVDWGDGNVKTYSGTFSTAPVTHTYAADGVYTVRVTGTASVFGFDSNENPAGLPGSPALDGWTYIYSLGGLGLTSLYRMAEYGFSFLKAVPSALPQTVTNIGRALSGAGGFNASRVTYNVGPWDVSRVTTMNGLFSGLTVDATDPIISSIAGWDVSSATNMSSMFSAVKEFNQDLSGWDVSSVTNMSAMFSGAVDFNQDIGGWDVSSVTNMSSMFGDATSFNQDLSTWDVSSVTRTDFMFSGGANPGDISGWDVSSVTNMQLMFYNNATFNANIATWNTASVTTMRRMFYLATSFNANIGSWNTAAVTDMNFMFNGATAFNQDIGGWSTGAVTNMIGMFQNATSFNRDLSGWCVTNITSAPTNFDSGATAWTLPSSRPVWGTCPP